MPTLNLPLPVLIALAGLFLYLAGEYIRPVGRFSRSFCWLLAFHLLKWRSYSVPSGPRKSRT